MSVQHPLDGDFATDTTAGLMRAVDYQQMVRSVSIDNVVSLTQTAYNALTPDANTLYVVTDAATQKAMRITDLTRTATATVADDPVLQVALTTGWWSITGQILVNSPAAADFKAAWTGPSDATGYLNWLRQASSASSNLGSLAQGVAAKDGTISMGTLDSTNMSMLFNGYVNIVTAGSLIIQWSQDTSNGGNTTVMAGSRISATRFV